MSSRRSTPTTLLPSFAARSENQPVLLPISRTVAGSNLTILNGTEGINEVVAGLVGQGLSILDTLKKSTAPAGNGVLPAALLEKSRKAGA